MIKKSLIFLSALLVINGTILGWGFSHKIEKPLGASASVLASKYDKSEVKTKYKLEGLSLKREIIKNPELDKYKGEPKDEIKVIVGEEPIAGLLGASSDFQPDIKLSRWNEVNFKLHPKDIDTVLSKDKSIKFEGDKIKFDTPKMSFEMYEATTTPDGGYKYVWYLNEKLVTNKVEFQIDSQGLEFFYQPPLTEEYKNGYSDEFKKEIVVTETQVKDLDGNVLAERPENVVGSYAVYHSTKGGMNDINDKEYKTGKAFHIYRPHIIDANGTETWGILHIENGIYSVEIPQEFLDTAVYPVKSNDTFGFMGVGTTTGNAANDKSYAIVYALSTSNVSVSKITIWQKTIVASGNDISTKGLIFDDNSSYPNNLLGTTQVTTDTGTTAELKDYTFSSPLTVISAVNYWLGWVTDVNASNLLVYYYDTGTTNQRYLSPGSGEYATPPNPFTASGVGAARKVYIYATYTPSASGPTGNTQIKSGTLEIKSEEMKINN
jgi:hypothetical protein